MVIVVMHGLQGTHVERFHRFFYLVSQTVGVLLSVVIKELHNFIRYYPHKIIAQMHYAPSALSRAKKRVQTKVKEVYTNVRCIHCCVHQLNLILEEAMTQNTNIQGSLMACKEQQRFSKISTQKSITRDHWRLLLEIGFQGHLQV